MLLHPCVWVCVCVRVKGFGAHGWQVGVAVGSHAGPAAGAQGPGRSLPRVQLSGAVQWEPSSSSGRGGEGGFTSRACNVLTGIFD